MDANLDYVQVDEHSAFLDTTIKELRIIIVYSKNFKKFSLLKQVDSEDHFLVSFLNF